MHKGEWGSDGDRDLIQVETMIRQWYMNKAESRGFHIIMGNILKTVGLWDKKKKSTEKP